MELANIVLKLDKIGTNTPLKHVTPAEVMLLVADHHTNAGGDPIVKCQIVPPNTEAKLIAACQVEIEKLEDRLAELEETELTEEIRERRQTSLLNRRTSQQEELARLQSIAARRELTPLQEKVRLEGRYGRKRVARMFPGGIPAFPATFREAVQGGIGAEQSSDKMLITVGDTGEPVTS